MAAIRAGDNISNDYLFYLLKNKEQEITGNSGAAFDSISRKDIQKIKVPLPPLEAQEEIVAELNGYQRVIAGARQVVENWKPSIKIDTDWPLVILGEETESTQLGLVKNKGEQNDKGEHPYIKMDNITNSGELVLSPISFVKATDAEMDKFTLFDGAFIYNTRNTPDLVGKCTVYHGPDKTYLYNNNILRVTFSDKINPDFIGYYLNSKEGKAKIKNLVSGTTSVAAIYQKDFATIKVPIPTLAIQNEIVEKVMKEKEKVNANKTLAELHEQKIKDKIAEVWGE